MVWWTQSDFFSQIIYLWVRVSDHLSMDACVPDAQLKNGHVPNSSSQDNERFYRSCWPRVRMPSGRTASQGALLRCVFPMSYLEKKEKKDLHFTNTKASTVPVLLRRDDGTSSRQASTCNTAARNSANTRKGSYFLACSASSSTGRENFGYLA